ncbi:MAG: hypothetical protein J0I20_11420 [Chloroflexi bacterium]|mgnify:CR=1 FL=1|nr:hypothetical protein [Chloroflexota bacterium]OJV92350.1 MAG: hypothetical protein BGO39_30940 [Chloroflexi bacterium 54-19]
MTQANPNDLETRKLLVDGVQALLAGNRAEAQQLLLSYVDRDEMNEEAWLWLSGAVDELDDIETSLQNCLQINPNNARAQQGLEWVARQRTASV